MVEFAQDLYSQTRRIKEGPNHFTDIVKVAEKILGKPVPIPALVLGPLVTKGGKGAKGPRAPKARREPLRRPRPSRAPRAPRACRLAPAAKGKSAPRRLRPPRARRAARTWPAPAQPSRTPGQDRCSGRRQVQGAPPLDRDPLDRAPRAAEASPSCSRHPRLDAAPDRGLAISRNSWGTTGLRRTSPPRVRNSCHPLPLPLWRN